jgi:hypothetical protein
LSGPHRYRNALLRTILVTAFMAGCQPTPDSGDTHVSVSVRNESNQTYVLFFFESSGAPMQFRHPVDIAADDYGVALEDHGPWRGSVAIASADCAVIGRYPINHRTIFVISPTGEIGTTDRLSDADIAREDNIYPDSLRCPAVP